MTIESHERRRKKLEGNKRKQKLDIIYERDRATCQICFEHVDRRDASRDHIKRLIDCTKAEARSLNNMRLAHKKCNEARDDYDPTIVVDLTPVRNAPNDDYYGPRRLYSKIGSLFPELQNMFDESD